MRKLVFILFIAIWAIACNGKKNNQPVENQMTTDQDKGLVTYKYKVVGLQDSLVSDSIWKIIFQLNGVDKLILSKNDSSAVFTVDPILVSNDSLKSEITRRGGVVID
jgi:hypothetical protein